MKVKTDFLRLGSFTLHNGSQIRFWEDVWLGQTRFSQLYSSLYNIVHRKHATVAEVLGSLPIHISFRRALVGDKLVAWNELVLRLASIQLTEGQDTFRWSLHQHGKFSVHSMYRALINGMVFPINRYLWKLKIPLKIKIFLWFLLNGVILTKDNLAKRQWNGSTKCCFCSLYETIQHLFFDCHFAKFIWRAVHISSGINLPSSISHMFGNWLMGINRKLMYLLLVGASALCWALWLSCNDVVFDKAQVSSVMQVIFRGTYWFRFWSLLQREEDHPILQDMGRRLETSVMEIYINHGWQFNTRLCL